MRRQIQIKIIQELKDIYQNLKPKSSKELINRFKGIEKIFKDELSAERSKFYNEIFDGIILAVSQFSQVDEKNRVEMFNLSKELLSYIYNELAKEKEIKKDIVFLPYKASMWDSLESIWQAANEDKEHCNAYVVPIPYADRKPDQNVAEWHCETKLFPQYVPVWDYRKFDLKKLHPDIIFIHNPYDNYNALTSVDSQYYSDKLKEYTDKLIYVPYFVMQDIKPGDEELEDKVAHFITTQGVFNSDLIFVQSENIRQVYINVLTRYTNQTDRKFWESKIIGLGSPKVDKILSTGKEQIKIPKEWLKILKKSGGTFKKVIFYNSGVSLALRWKQYLLDKMEDDFRIFKENQDDVTLLWRPHPLMSATMLGMLPELHERYENIVKEYKEEGWGIYDDTADADRAMALSDAYFGDGSSLLKLYEITGKPVIHHNITVKAEKTESFKIANAYYENKYIWCTMFYDPNLYRINLETKEIEFITKILDEDEKLHSFINILSYKNFFIFIQSATGKLILMNRENFTKKNYQIPNQSSNIKNSKFVQAASNGFIFADDLYIFGFDYKGIIKFNLKTKKFEVIDKFLKDLKIRKKNEKFSLRDYIKIKEKVYFPFVNTNAVLELSLNDDSTILHYVGDEKQSYISGTYDGKNIWLTPRNGASGEIVKWDIANNKFEQYPTPIDEEKYTTRALFYTTLKIENKIFIMSLRAINNNVEIDLEKKEINLFDDFDDERFYLGEKYSCPYLEGENFYYINNFNLMKHDFKKDLTEKIELKPTLKVKEEIERRREERLKFIFSPNEEGRSMTATEQTRLNLYHMIEFLKIE